MGMMINRRRVMGRKETPLDYNDSLVYIKREYDCDTIQKAIYTNIAPITDNWFNKSLLIAVYAYPKQTGSLHNQHHFGGVEVMNYEPYPSIGLMFKANKFPDSTDIKVGNNLYVHRNYINEDNVGVADKFIINKEIGSKHTLSYPSNAYYKSSTCCIGLGRTSDGRFAQGYFYEFAFFNRCITDEEVKWWLNKYKHLIQ